MSNVHPVFDEIFREQFGDRRKYTGESISNTIQAARLDYDDLMLILDSFNARVKGKEFDDSELEMPLRTLYKAYEELEEAIGRIEARLYEPEPYERNPDE